MKVNLPNPHDFLEGLPRVALPKGMLCSDSVDSTMDVAREQLDWLSDRKIPVAILVDEQRQGRGRMGRQWLAPSGTSVLLSIAMRPTWLKASQVASLIWIGSIAVCEAIAEITDLNPLIKWPNDVVIPQDNPVPGERVIIKVMGDGDASSDTIRDSVRDNMQELGLDVDLDKDDVPVIEGDDNASLLAQQLQGALQGRGMTAHLERHDAAAPEKVAGILLESGSKRRFVEWAVLGIGINVSNSPPLGFVNYPPTSLWEATGQEIDRGDVLHALFKHLDTWYVRLQEGEHEAIYGRWRSLLHTIGREVTIDTRRGQVKGVAEDVDPWGALRVRDEDGKVHIISNGDVNAP